MNINNCKVCSKLYYANTKLNGKHYHEVYGLCIKCVHLWEEK